MFFGLRGAQRSNAGSIVNVLHAVKMVDSCSRENGVLCNVARSWLLFLHDESEWKNLESNIT